MLKFKKNIQEINRINVWTCNNNKAITLPVRARYIEHLFQK